MEKYLAPCPFCGKSAEIMEPGLSIEKTVNCLECGAGAFITDWNTRPLEDALQAEIARLRAALAGMLLAFPVDVYRMLAGHPNCDMERADVAVTKARAALKGGE